MPEKGRRGAAGACILEKHATHWARGGKTQARIGAATQKDAMRLVKSARAAMVETNRPACSIKWMTRRCPMRSRQRPGNFSTNGCVSPPPSDGFLGSRLNRFFVSGGNAVARLPQEMQLEIIHPHPCQSFLCHIPVAPRQSMPASRSWKTRRKLLNIVLPGILDFPSVRSENNMGISARVSLFNSALYFNSIKKP